MAQRRYTDAELNALRSGETAPPDQSWFSTALKPYVPDWAYTGAHALERADRNIAAGIANLPANLLETPHSMYSLGRAGYDWATGAKPFTQSLSENMMGGADNLNKLQQYVSQKTQEYMSELSPQEQQDQAMWARAEGAVRASKEFNDYQQSLIGGLSSTGNWMENKVNDYMGVNPTYRQSFGDEVGQIVGGAIVPIDAPLAVAGKVIPEGVKAVAALPGIRHAVGFGEAMLPGSVSPSNAVANAVIPTAIDYGLRTASGAPTFDGQESTVATSSDMGKGDRVTQEDANAPSPFFVADQGAASTLPQPDGSVPPQFAQPPVPDRDAQGGGGGAGWFATLGIAGAAAVAAAAMRGRVPTGVATQIINDVDSPNAARRLEPVATDAALDPTLSARYRDASWRTRGQKIMTGAQKSRALPQTAENAFLNSGLAADNPHVRQSIDRIEREAQNASRLEVSNAHHRSITRGEVPGLDRQTVPLENLYRLQASKDWTPEDNKLFMQKAAYADRLSRYEYATKTLTDQISDLNAKLRLANTPRQRYQITSEISSLEQQVQARIKDDAVVTNGMTVKQIKDINFAAEANPRTSLVFKGLQKIRDDFFDAGVKRGMWSQGYVDRMKALRPNMLPVEIDPYAKSNPYWRMWDKAVELTKGRHEPGETMPWSVEMYSGKRAPKFMGRTNRSTYDAAADELQNPLDTMSNAIFDYHRQERTHRAAQTWTETILGTNDWGKTVKRARAPMSVQEWERKQNTKEIRDLINDPLVYVYNKDGMMHVMKAADTEVARAMRFNPSSVMFGLNTLRKISQSVFTGPLAPWFSPLAAEYELGVARAKLPSKYVKGPLDQLLKNVFPNSPVGKIFDFYPDPSFRLWQLGSLIEQTSAKAIRTASKIMGKRMDMQSPFLSTIGNSEQMAEGGIRAFNNMRMRHMFIENNIIRPMHEDVVMHNEGMWRLAQSVLGKSVPSAARSTIDSYMSLMDTVRNSVKYPLAAHNLDLLIKKYKGFDNIPADVMRDFVRDFRHLSGDMTQAIGSPVVANLASVIPYGQTWVNSTLHYGSGIMERPLYTSTRLFTNGVLPKILWVTALTYAMTNKDGSNPFVDYFWDAMPEWQREGTIPMVSPQYVAEIATGKYRQPTLDDLIFMKQAPESIPYTEVMMGMLRSGGWFGAHTHDPGFTHSLLQAIQSALPLNSTQGSGIPIVDALYKGLSGQDQSAYQGPGFSNDSDQVRTISDALGAVFGASVDITRAGLSAMTDSYEHNNGIPTAIADGFMHAGAAVAQKFPEMPYTPTTAPIWGGQRRHYTKGQTRERNQARFKIAEQIANQMSEQKKDNSGRMGADRLDAITDPTALRMAREIQSYVGTGLMRTYTSKRAALYSQIERLDANRSLHTPAEYLRLTEQLKSEINDIDLHEQDIFDRLEQRLQAAYGIPDLPSALKYLSGQTHP